MAILLGIDLKVMTPKGPKVNDWLNEEGGLDVSSVDKQRQQAWGTQWMEGWTGLLESF